jgi:sialic acid synthase
MREIVIANTLINDDSGAFVVAEIGCNHQGDLGVAKQMIKAAADAGAHACKLQKRALGYWAAQGPEQWRAPYHSEHAFGPTYGEHRAALEFDRAQYVDLKAYAESLGLVFFATAFDIPSVDFLAELDVPALKIASASIVNLPLLQAAAETGLPLIVSTGGATLREIDQAVNVVYPFAPLVLMHCVSAYPCEARLMNLNVVPALRERYPSLVIGLSDHYNGIALGPVAFTIGARLFEKHFTLNRGWKGSDQAWSLEPGGLRRLVRDLKRTREALGDGVKQRHPEEVAPLVKMGRDLAELEAGVSR